MAKTVHFRFDIDTISCISEGIDPLLQLARELGLQFTFFANMGQSISRREILLRTPGRTLGNVLPQKVAKVSALKKLGARHTLHTLLLNPRIGASHIATLERILAEGHELGLHGGSNHATWQRQAHLWSEPQIVDALGATHEDFQRRFGAPAGFASPGGNGSAVVYKVLQQLGYRYVSDFMEPGVHEAFVEPCGLLHIPINLQIAQVPLLESLHAQGLSDAAVVERAAAAVNTCALRTAVGHPCFEGKQGLPLLRALCTRLLDDGYTFRPYHALLTAA